ncbi:SWI/SNF complex subunit SWI3D [Rhynchospora pubera]|uniref:SWI/SNF complex subunit SWI3D n=1 Tax=Rhynchospora pubera TaxID=906938 RepID=A0AAV8D5B8_9POAL|nr:SWI/SNF complex subunit SWI3D [Rhynchospora pubera]
METKSSDPSPASAPAAETSNHRRRGGNPKRKAATAALSALSNLSAAFSTPSKRQSKDRNPSPIPHHMLFQSHHSGPLTRARQSPNKLAGSADDRLERELMIDLNGAALAGSGLDPIAAEEEAEDPLTVRREEEESVVNLEFEAVKSREKNVHVVPTFAGWFSWNSIHEIEKQTLVSFFDGKSEKRTPELYMTIRNSIMKKFHSNPQSQIELKDLTESSKDDDSDSWQEVMEFLDHWGLINFHPFPPNSEDTPKSEEDAKGDKKNASLVDKLYQFETTHMQVASVPITKKIEAAPQPTLAPVQGVLPEPGLGEDSAALMEPSIEYHCNSCQADCSRKRYHCRTQADFDLCTDCYTEGKFGTGMAPADFILMESAEAPGAGGATWTDEETLLLLEALELFGANWNEIADHVGTKTKAQCMLHFLEVPIEDSFLYANEDNTTDGTKNEKVEEKQETEVKGKENEKEKEEIEGEKDSSGENASDKIEIDEKKDSDGKDGEKVGDLDRSEPSDTDHLDEKKDSDENKDSVLGECTPGTAIDVLKDAFNAVGYLPEEAELGSFADAGNPVMALAAFLTGLVENDNSMTSCHRSSLKAMSESSPALQLATRHCFILDDPPADDVSNALQLSASESRKEETATPSADKNNDNSIPDTQKENDIEKGKEPSNATEGNAKEEQNNNERETELRSDTDVDNKSEPHTDKMEVEHEPKQMNGPTSNLEESGPSERKEATAGSDEKPSKTNAGNGNSKDSKEVIRLKRAAATAVAAAAVKAKFLAKQEEDQIRQLVTVILEKQFRKMEAKLTMFSELDNIITRVREQADKLRMRLVQERSQLMAARQRVNTNINSTPNPNQPSMAANRLAAAYASAIAGGVRPPNMVSDRLQTMPTRRS